MLMLHLVLFMANFVPPTDMDTLSLDKRFMLEATFIEDAPILKLEQNQYTGLLKIAGQSNEYSVTHNTSSYIPYILLENVNNVYLKENPYDTVTGETYTIANHPQPSVWVKKADLDAIVSQVFSEDEINSYTNKVNPVTMTYAVDSHTGKVLEVRFYIQYRNNDERLLGIPIEQFEQLEEKIKEQLVLTVPESGRNASYLRTEGSIFRNL